MKLCPYCAEEIQDAAIRCKHCRSDLPSEAAAGADAARRGARRAARGLALTLSLLAVLVAAGPVVARPLLGKLQAGAAAEKRSCEPTNWMEWHSAMRQQCLKPSYVCEHMTTGGMLSDPDVARSYQAPDADTSALAALVGKMRSAYGCAPEPGREVPASPHGSSPHGGLGWNPHADGPSESFAISQDGPKDI